MNKIQKAVEFAIVVHKGQTRKGGNNPFILHPLESGIIAQSILTQLGMESEIDEVVAAAILHDTIEDTNVTEEDIMNRFGQNILDMVLWQSEDKTKSWHERKSYTLESLDNLNDSKESELLKILILADKLANMREIKRDYDKLGDKLWDIFNVKDKAKHKWYYQGIRDKTVSLRGVREYKEYSILISQVFDS